MAIERRPATATVLKGLVDYIQSEELGPGDRLPSIRQLSEVLGIGRNAIRDGLVQAESMGLVRISPRSGTTVQSPDLSPMMNILQETLESSLSHGDRNIVHLLEARRAIEVETVPTAAGRRRMDDVFALREILEGMQRVEDDRAAFILADEDFHVGIARIAGNPVFVTMLKVLLVMLRPYRSRYVLGRSTAEVTSSSHEDIYRCIVEGDVEGARKATENHHNYSVKTLLELISTVPKREQADRAPVL